MQSAPNHHVSWLRVAAPRSWQSDRHAGALEDASLQMQFDERVRKEIRNTLTYPMFLIVMRTAATLFILLVVVPQFPGMMKGRLQLIPPFSRGIFSSAG